MNTNNATTDHGPQDHGQNAPGSLPAPAFEASKNDGAPVAGVVYSMDFKRGNLVPLQNPGLPVGTVIYYEDRANPRRDFVIVGDSHRLDQGHIDLLSPREGDIHEVSNALPDRPSISIHVYGANIGGVRRHVYEPETGVEKPFVSGYSSAQIPNFWDRSDEVRAHLVR
jgi:hypothetical protein